MNYISLNKKSFDIYYDGKLVGNEVAENSSSAINSWLRKNAKSTTNKSKVKAHSRSILRFSQKHT